LYFSWTMFSRKLLYNFLYNNFKKC
jgi:hypothetical protein